MSRFLLLLSCFLLLSTLSFAQKKKLIGEWKMTAIDGKTPPERETKLRLVFFKNGTFEMRDTDRTMPGTWTLNKAEKTINIMPSNEEPRSLKIVSITKNTVELDNEGNVASFQKVGKATSPKKKKVKLRGDAKKLLGCWQVKSAVGGEMPDNDVFFQFNKDATIWYINGANGVSGNWTINPPQKGLTMEIGGRGEEVRYKFKDKELHLSSNSEGFSLVKVKKKFKVLPGSSGKTSPEIEEIEEETVEEEAFPGKVFHGNWKVLNIDGDDVQERNIRFVLNKNKTFSIEEGGEIQRSGNWKKERGGRNLYIKDSENLANTYEVKLLDNQQLIISDYYGRIELRKD